MRLALIISLFIATPTLALELALPNSAIVAIETSDAASVRLPEASWSPSTVVPGTEGAIRRTVLKLPDAQWTTLQLIGPLRDKLEEAGYVQVFACADAECGGFDFRFQLDLIGEPAMYVDLGNYRYLLMRHPSKEPHSVALVASPTTNAGNVHVTEVSSARFPEVEPDAEDVEAEMEGDADHATQRPGNLAASLLNRGHVVLDALEFGSGSADLGNGPYPVLAELAAWLLDNPSARIVLVGHTDSMGSLETNTTLSRRRAEAVANRLIEAFGIKPSRLEAAGAGYLSPIESNLTEAGRTANRRVEAVLISVE
ncbi:MAG: OmpA family protein [Boseongicola sp.]|nr:OmpA family protein [Boseongicola sp.]